MTLSGISCDGLIQAAAALIVGAVFLVNLRRAIEPEKPIAFGIVAAMLLPVYFWICAIAVAVSPDLLAIFGMLPAPESYELVTVRMLQFGLLLLVLGLLTFIGAIIYASLSARSKA